MTLLPKTHIFLLKKWAKLLHCKSFSHFFNKKNWQILDINVWKFNETLTYDVVSFEQPGPDLLLIFKAVSIHYFQRDITFGWIRCSVWGGAILTFAFLSSFWKGVKSQRKNLLPCTERNNKRIACLIWQDIFIVGGKSSEAAWHSALGTTLNQHCINVMMLKQCWLGIIVFNVVHLLWPGCYFTGSPKINERLLVRDLRWIKTRVQM